MTYQPPPQPGPLKSRTVAGLLQLLPPLVGLPGIGRLYTGHVSIGLLQLLGSIIGVTIAVCGSWMIFPLLFLAAPIVFGLWSIVDGIIILVTPGIRDADGRPMT